MKRILFTLLLAVVLYGGIAVEGVLAADRNYKIKNCNRKKLWEDFSIYLQIYDPETIEFLDKKIKPNKEAPKLTESDYEEIEKFDKKLHYYISECILLMKEINQLTRNVSDVNPNKAFDITIRFKYILVMNDIPFLSKWNKRENRQLFSINFAPLMPGKSF